MTLIAVLLMIIAVHIGAIEFVSVSDSSITNLTGGAFGTLFVITFIGDLKRAFN